MYHRAVSMPGDSGTPKAAIQLGSPLELTVLLQARPGSWQIHFLALVVGLRPVAPPLSTARSQQGCLLLHGQSVSARKVQLLPDQVRPTQGIELPLDLGPQ